MQKIFFIKLQFNKIIKIISNNMVKMKKIGLIPCRMESSRLPNKPLKEISGLPMFSHVYFRAKLSGLDEVYVCTDSDEITEVAKKFKIPTILTSKDHKNGTERCAEAARKLNLSSEDLIVDVQGDEPFINPIDINNLIKNFNNNLQDILLGYTIEPNSNNVNTVKITLNHNSKVLYFSRNDIPYNFRSNVKLIKQTGLVGFSFSALNNFVEFKPTEIENIEGIELLRAVFYEMKIFGFEIHKYTSSVDTVEDLEFARDTMKSDEIVNQYIGNYVQKK